MTAERRRTCCVYCGARTGDGATACNSHAALLRLDPVYTIARETIDRGVPWPEASASA